LCGTEEKKGGEKKPGPLFLRKKKHKAKEARGFPQKKKKKKGKKKKKVDPTCAALTGKRKGPFPTGKFLKKKKKKKVPSIFIFREKKKRKRRWRGLQGDGPKACCQSSHSKNRGTLMGGVGWWCGEKKRKRGIESKTAGK